METFKNIALIVGVCGGILGVINTWLIINDRRKGIAILSRKERGLLRIHIANLSLQEIPLEAVTIQFPKEIGVKQWGEERPAKVENISFPATLAPRTSREVRWEVKDAAALAMYKRVRITVLTQIGNKISKKYSI